MKRHVDQKKEWEQEEEEEKDDEGETALVWILTMLQYQLQFYSLTLGSWVDSLAQLELNWMILRYCIFTALYFNMATIF